MDWAIERLRVGQSLEFDEMIKVMDLIMSGSVETNSIVELLTLLHNKGESISELAGAAKSLQQKMTPIACDRPYLIDTCGTGGSGKNTFNISTASALVTAAAGAAVAKHGNRAITGKSGSADLLQELGVKVDASLVVTEKCLNEIGICFCFAPLFHPSVRHASEARKKLEFPTIFNLLGPLCNPAQAPYQLLGAGRGETRELLASALAELGTKRSAVVHGRDGIGEISIGAPTDASLVEGDVISNKEWSPADFEVDSYTLDQIQVTNPSESAKMVCDVLDNRPGAPLEIVVANSAAALWLVGIAQSPAKGSSLAREVISTGKAKQVLEDLAQMSNS